MGKPIRCTLIMNASRTGHIFLPIDCGSINEAIKTAKDYGFPYRIYREDGKLIRKGRFVKQ